MAENCVVLKNKYYEVSVDLKQGTWSVKDRITGVWGSVTRSSVLIDIR